MIEFRVPGPTLGDRVGAVIDRLTHPRRTRLLARATHGFRDAGVIRRYANDAAGRRLEATEARILWRRGYRGPLAGIHDAIWRTGAPVITITFSREQVPGFLTPYARREASRRGVLERR
jgi:hypothetical protein